MDLFTRSLEADPDEILIGMNAAPMRRLIGVLAMVALSAVLLWHGYQKYSDTGSGLGAILLALAGLFAALRMWQSSSIGLVLTPTELRDTEGRQVVRVTDIAAVNREPFGIFKPTNGFVIETWESLPAAISLGIWWRLGKRIGIGGFTGAGEGKAMAELLQEMLKRQQAED